MIDRISTYGHMSTLMQQTMRLQSDYAAKQTQSASGLKSQNYQGISQNAQQLLNLESMYSRITGQVASSNAAQNKVNVMYDSLGQMSDLLTSTLGTISGALGGSASDAQSTFEQARNELVSLLNSSYDGQYLFAGSMTDTAPVDITDADYDATGATADDTSYYQGNSQKASVKVSDTLTITYGITADNSAFANALQALGMAINNPSDSTSLQQAYDLLKSASGSIANLQSQVSDQASTIDTQVTLQTTTLDHLDNTISDMRNVDVAAVSVQLSEIETQLEAAYSSLSKLLNLNLTDYLR